MPNIEKQPPRRTKEDGLHPTPASPPIKERDNQEVQGDSPSDDQSQQ